MDRNEAIARIKAALARRSSRPWSVTGGRGTAWGWITIDAPPRLRTWRDRPRAGVNENDMTLPHAMRYELVDTGEPGGCMGPGERAELAGLLDLEHVHCQGVSIPASSDYYEEYVDRAQGRTPAKLGKPYWD